MQPCPIVMPGLTGQLLLGASLPSPLRLRGHPLKNPELSYQHKRAFPFLSYLCIFAQTFRVFCSYSRVLKTRPKFYAIRIRLTTHTRIRAWVVCLFCVGLLGRCLRTNRYSIPRFFVLSNIEGRNKDKRFCSRSCVLKIRPIF